MKVAIYARVSTGDQHSLPMQVKECRAYCRRQKWEVVREVEEIASGAKNDRPRRQELLKLAGQGKLDAIIVWRLDRWGRSTLDLLNTLTELNARRVAFVSINEALDLTTPTGRAMAAFLAVIAEFERELIQGRVKAGIRRYREENAIWGRPARARAQFDEVRRLNSEGMNHSQIAKRLNISRSSVLRALR